MTGRLRWIAGVVAGGILLGALWLCQHPAREAPFYYDTRLHLLDKSDLQLRELTAPDILGVVQPAGRPAARPASRLTLALNYWAAGSDPAPYRTTNLLIHWAACGALAFFLLSFLGTAFVQERYPELYRLRGVCAVAIVVAWGLHPIQTNVTTYVIQRMASLAGLFSFLALGAYLRARAAAAGWSWRWGVGCLLSLALALASKETALATVALLPLLEWWAAPRPVPPHTRRLRWVLGGTLAALLVSMAAVLDLPGLFHYLQQLYASQPYSPGQRLLSEARLQPIYLLLLLVPDPRLLSLVGHEQISTGLLQPPATLAGVTLCLLLLAAAAFAVRRHPLLSFGVLWFFAAQLVEASVLPLDLYAEYRLYVPAVGVYLVLAWSLLRWMGHGPRTRAALLVAVALVGAIEATATYRRNQLWADPVRFWADTADKQPASARARLAYGHALLARNQLQPAWAVLGQAAALGGSGRSVALVGMAQASLRLGKLARAREEALRAEQALGGDGAITADAPVRVRQTLGLIALLGGQLEEAEEYLQQAAERAIGRGESLRLLGLVELAREDAAAAESYLRRAAAADPGNALVWNNLGSALERQGRTGPALEAYRRARSLEPGNARHRADVERVGSPQ